MHHFYPSPIKTAQEESSGLVALFAEPIIGLIIGGVGSTVVLLILLVIGVRVHNNNNNNNENNGDGGDEGSGPISCTGNHSGNTSALSSSAGVSIAPCSSSSNGLNHLHNSHSLASFIASSDNCNILSTATLSRTPAAYRTSGTCTLTPAFAPAGSTSPVPPSTLHCHSGHRSSLSQLIVTSGNNGLTCITPPPPLPSSAGMLTPLGNMKVNINTSMPGEWTILFSTFLLVSLAVGHVSRFFFFFFFVFFFFFFFFFFFSLLSLVHPFSLLSLE